MADRNLVPELIAATFRKIEPEFARRVADAQVFDFGDEFTDGTRLKYLLELFACGFIDTPYPTVLYRFGTFPDRWAMVIDRKLPPNEGCTRSYRAALYHWWPLKERYDLRVQGAFHFAQPDAPQARMSASMSGPKKEIGEWLLHSFMHCSMVLATEGVPRRVEEAPTRLNAKRARSGKPPIPTVTHIDFRAYAKAAAAEPGHHASPVCHLRRGHIRRFEDGRKTWVRDCIVNASEDVKVTKRDAYILDSRIAKTPKKVNPGGTTPTGV